MKDFILLMLLLIPIILFLLLFCCFSFIIFLLTLGFSEDGKRLIKQHRPLIQLG